MLIQIFNVLYNIKFIFYYYYYYYHHHYYYSLILLVNIHFIVIGSLDIMTRLSESRFPSSSRGFGFHSWYSFTANTINRKYKLSIST